MIVAITGATGFIGRHLVAALVARGVRVTVPSRRREGVGSYDQEHHDISLRYMDGKIGRVASLHDVLRELD